MKHLSRLLALWIITSLLNHFAFAENLANGQALHQSKCVQCHADKSGLGNADMIYLRTDHKVKDMAKLKSMVSRCNTELRLDLFPEDEADLVAHLNQTFYRLNLNK